MSSELTLLRDYKKDKEPTRWCVYYEADTGDIVTVTNKEKDFIKSPFILSDSDDARKILMGHLDPKKFAVVDVNQELKLVEKSAVLRIKEAEEKLSMIPTGQKQKADINVIMYVNNWKMEVNFNQDTLYRMTGKRYFRNVSLNPESDGNYDNITLYLIKDNDPNFLIKTISIDPGELIEEGYLIFDMTPLRRITGLGEISILTKKIFSSYRLERKANFTGIDYRKSNFNNPQDQKIYTDIGIYLTDPKNPNRLLGSITLPLNDIGWESTIELQTDLNLLECGFLCKESSNDLTFDYVKTTEIKQ